MSTRRSRRSPKQLIPLIVAAVVVVFFMLRSRDRSEPATVQTPARSSTARSAPQINPLHARLAPPEGVERRPGLAVAVLVDVSGSMKRPVPAGQGGPGEQEVKIDAARRCVVDLVEQIDAHARARAQSHPLEPIMVGLYEFSSRERGPNCRTLLAPAPPDPEAARQAVARMRPVGGTPIGDAIIMAKGDLDELGLERTHLLVITDGQNTQGYDPADVADALYRLPEPGRPALYFVAFDVSARVFDPVRDAGGLVLGAGSAADLKQTLDYILTGKILAEQPEIPSEEATKRPGD